MTDAELIARLLGWARDIQAGSTAIWAMDQDLKAAADRIEALTAKLATCEKYRDAYDEMGRIGTQAVRDLEAKLAENEVRLRKAVEVLNALDATLARNGWHVDSIAREDIRATLTQIKERAMSDEELIDYTDPDIIARQNIAPNAGCNIDGKFYDVRNLVHLASSQADRIEALTKERDQHWDSFVHWRKQADDLTGQLAAARDDAKEAEAYAEEVEREQKGWQEAAVKLMNKLTTSEAKLAECEARLRKAVEALEDIKLYSSCGDTRRKAIETLAEIKGESHE